MALDWNKEINLSTLKELFGGSGKRGRQGGSAYPTKTTMNLYQGDSGSTDVRQVILVGVLLAVAIAAFVKVGVLDQLELLSSKQAELSQQEMLVNVAKGKAQDYESIKEAYDAYMARYGSDAADAIAVLDMVESRVMPTATVTAIVLSDGTLTLTLYDVPLSTVGNLAKDLEVQDMVAAVNVSTATTQNAEGQNTVSTLVVTLVSALSEEG